MSLIHSREQEFDLKEATGRAKALGIDIKKILDAAAPEIPESPARKPARTARKVSGKTKRSASKRPSGRARKAPPKTFHLTDQDAGDEATTRPEDGPGEEE